MELPSGLPVPQGDWERIPILVQELIITQIAMLQEQIGRLEAEVARLREQVNQNSQNSSKPPSSDGPGVPPRPKGTVFVTAQRSFAGQLRYALLLQHRAGIQATLSRSLSRAVETAVGKINGRRLSVGTHLSRPFLALKQTRLKTNLYDLRIKMCSR